MMNTGLVVDGLLVALLVGAAAAALLARDGATSVALFVSFGLFSALAWTRLDAPDVALAEAAIGSGLTGALLFDALPALRRSDPRVRAPGPLWGEHAARTLRAGLATLLAGALWVAVRQVPGTPGPAAQLAHQALPGTGLGNPVTGVLLVYRAYDTFLEVAVLFIAVLGALALLAGGGRAAQAGGPVFPAVVRLVVPAVGLVSVYLVWVGSDAPGGAFQGGAVAGGALVMMAMAGLLPSIESTPGAPPRLALRGVLVAGVVAFGLVVLGTSALGQALLVLPTPLIKPAAIGIELAIWPATAVTIWTLFHVCATGRPVPQAGR